MTDFKVTVESARGALHHGDLKCINDSCMSEDIVVNCMPGSTAELTKESYLCQYCNTFWIAEMYAARVETIHSPTGIVYGSHDFSEDVERGVFHQTVPPTGLIKEALEEFLTAMKIGSTHRKGEALATLAFMARVKL